jgi:general secretion pathway protein C
MIDISKILGRWASMPWREGLVVLGGSFVAATMVSTFLGQLYLGKKDPKLVKPSMVKVKSFEVSPPTPSLSQPAIDKIVARNLFGADTAAESSSKTDDQTPKEPNQPVKSDLQIKLMGTIYGGDPFSGIALVENSAKRTINSFMVGEMLLKDATIAEIHKEKIIIQRNGRLEYIEVERTPLARSRRKKNAGPQKSQSPADTIAPIATDPPPPNFKEEGFERKERDIVMTQSYRSKLLTTDFTKVLQDAKATPNMRDGELKGFVLTRIRKDSIYEKAGLQNDDIVEEINGVPLTDTAQAIRLLQSLRNESDIEVRVNRAGSPMKFSLNIR